MNKLMAGVLAVLGMTFPAMAQEKNQPPNILFMLVDDLGFADLGCYGSTFYKTPHIDALAARGVRFLNMYSAGAVCSPTRSSILTGKYPVRTGITDWIPGQKVKDTKLIQPETALFLDPREISFATLLRQKGYAAFYGGKWHLGNPKSGSEPAAFGFDVHYSGDSLRSAKSPFTTDSITVHTAAFIREQAGKKQPFIAYVSYYDVHTPLYEHPAFIQQYPAVGSQVPAQTIREREGITTVVQDNRQYASMVSVVDHSVGELSGLLQELGIDGNTIVVFTSDNGGLSTRKNGGPTSNSPLRAGKGWLYEGGIRVPLIVKHPTTGKKGVAIDAPVISTDFFPTLLEWAGLPLRPELHRDGISWAPLLEGHPGKENRELYWHYPHYHGSSWTPGAAVRSGDWKLIVLYETEEHELYNLKDDPYEKNNLAAGEPETARRLLAKLEAWQRETGAKLPVRRTDGK